MKYFVLLTGLIFVCYLLGFIKKPEKYQWMDRNYTTAIKGFSIWTVVWAHSGAMLSVGGIQFVAGIGVALFLMQSLGNTTVSSSTRRSAFSLPRQSLAGSMTKAPKI